MISSICIFEDNFYRRLLPLVYFRPVYDLRCGILTLREKILRGFPRATVTLHSRWYLTEALQEENPDLRVNRIDSSSCLFINGRVLANEEFFKILKSLEGEDELLIQDGTVVAGYLSAERLEATKRKLDGVLSLADFGEVKKKEINVTMIRYPWDLVHLNPKEISTDFKLLAARTRSKKLRGKVYPGAHLLNRKNIVMEKGSAVLPGSVLNAEEGPIYIGKGAKVFPNSTIIGPAFVGEKTLIKSGAKIYEGTSIGEYSKVGGEVEGTIIHSYSNKQHDGFLGHSYLGMWVNLGAGTSNSDLKNNYSEVDVIIDGEKINTGSMFVGLFMGDHSKAGINSMFNTGTVVGVCSNIFGAVYPPKYLPSFTWGGTESLTTYDLERCKQVAEKVMSRRQKPFTAAQKKLMEKVFELTREERQSRGMAE